MKRFSLIMLSQTGNKKVIYDYNSCEYMQHIETASKGTGYTWLLFQSIAVFGLELFGVLSKFALSSRFKAYNNNPGLNSALCV